MGNALTETGKVIRFGGTKHYVSVSPKKNEYGEFVVNTFKHGKVHEPSTYFTSDWEDAVGTAKHMHGALEKEFGTLGENITTETKKTLQEYVREDKLTIVESASGKQTLYKESANTNDKLLLYVAEDAQQMKNYFRTRNAGVMPPVLKEEDMSKNITESSMFQGGPDNTTTGNPGTDYRTYLAAELFGSTAFASQVPTADTHQEQAVIQSTQAAEGMGALRPSGTPANNMYESSISNQLIKLTKDLFRAGKINEASKIADALEQPQNAAAFVLEAAMATDGSVDKELTEDLYQTAAVLNSLQEG